MNRNYQGKTLIIVIFLFSLLVPRALCDASIYFKQSEYEINHIGQRFIIDIVAENVTDLFAWNLGVKWSHNLDLVSILEGPFLKETENTLFLYQYPPKILNEVENRSKAREISCIKIGSTGTSGSGVVASLVFEYLEDMNASIDFYKSTLLTPEENRIQHSTSTALIYFNEKTIVANAGDDRTINEGKITVLNASRSEGTNLTYQWSIIEDENIVYLNNITHDYVFEKPGTYIVKLNVSNNYDSSTDILAINVEDITPPVIVYELEGVNKKNAASVRKAIHFNASASYDLEGQLLYLYQWDMGDGTRLLGDNVTHAYSEPGNYKVELNLTDSSGNVSTETFNIEIYLYDYRKIVLYSFIIILLLGYIGYTIIKDRSN